MSRPTWRVAYFLVRNRKNVVEMSKQIVGAAYSNNDKNAIKIYPNGYSRSFTIIPRSRFSYNIILISY